MSGEVLLTVNSPGEVATWLSPVVRALRSVDPEASVTVFLMPCTYASGAEAGVVARIPGVDRVIPSADSLRLSLFGAFPRGFSAPKKGVLLYLGGEFFLAARLARRLATPAAAYTEGYINSHRAFERVFVPREQAKGAVVGRGVAAERVAVVGDLMVDAAWSRLEQEAEALPTSEPRDGCALLALLPGSRPHEVRHALPLLLRTGAEIARARSNVRFTVPISPFASAEAFHLALEDVGVTAHRREIEALFTQAENASLRLRLPVAHMELDVALERSRPADAMARADLALTIPGSNTAELAVYGVPMIVCLPLDRPEEIPLDGVLGLVDKVPVVGRRLKAAAVLKVAERMRFAALPNRVAGEYVVPELKSTSLDPVQIAEEALALLDDPERLGRMRIRLKELMGPRGASQAIAEWLVERLDRVGSAGRPSP